MTLFCDLKKRKEKKSENGILPDHLDRRKNKKMESSRKNKGHGGRRMEESRVMETQQKKIL